MAGWCVRLGLKHMLSLKIKDLVNRHAFNHLEKSRIIDKFLFINISSKNRVLFPGRCNFIPLNKKQLRCRKGFKIRITRRCIFNNRNRGVLRPFGISRVYLRELMQFGLLPGYAKAVW